MLRLLSEALSSRLSASSAFVSCTCSGRGAENAGEIFSAGVTESVPFEAASGGASSDGGRCMLGYRGEVDTATVFKALLAFVGGRTSVLISLGLCLRLTTFFLPRLVVGNTLGGIFGRGEGTISGGTRSLVPTGSRN